MADLDDLLAKTSRTFALSIPLLPEPTRREVTVAYLLFRIADTFEDGTSWAPARRVKALGELRELITGAPRPEEAARRSRDWLDEPPGEGHRGYLELLAETPFVLQELWSLRPEAQDAIRHHLKRTVEGMSRFLSRARGPGRLQLRSLDDLSEYCYVVAGIVGELLTELYLLGFPDLDSVSAPLRLRARCFGEGLQLVNILKDSAADVEEGRSFLPPAVTRAQVFDRARQDLEAAAEYTEILQQARAPKGVVAFNALPVLLARATLDRVEEAGPGAKVPRPQVYEILAEMERALAAGEPAVPLPGRERVRA
jgi:farnesyl-diphosphate farnesyltransferase